MPPIDPQVLTEIGIVVVGVGVWLLAFWAALLLTRPRPIPSPPPTQEFGGPESPAVVSLITGRWELTEDAAESTLIDLAARRLLEFRQPGNDPLQTTVHVRTENARQAAELNTYETMIYERVGGLARGDVVPLTALTFRNEAEAKGWTRRLNASIVADARKQGLSQRRFTPAIVTALTIAAAIPSSAIGLAVSLDTQRRPDGDASAGLWVAIFAWAAFGFFAGKSRGERDTKAGRAAAARWLGLKTFLRNQESFADLPPAAVTVWDRYLSYGDAVGATRVCSAVIDLGMGNRRRVWSSFGGTWHRVRVRYPGFFPRYGQKAVRLILKALAGLAITALLVRGSSSSVVTSLTTGFDIASIVRLIVLLPLLYGGYTLIATIIDLFMPVTVTGEVLWIETWKARKQGENSSAVPWLHYLAVDAGTSDRTVAWACPSDLTRRAGVGDVVTLTARRWTRRVLTLSVESTARSRATVYEDEKTDQLIQKAMGAGAPALATAVRPSRVVPAELVTAEEAGRVLGKPVTLSGADRAVAVGPMSIAEFRAADGSAILLAVTTGLAAKLALRVHRGGTAVAGVGDEAFASGQWAVARRGETVVSLEQRGAGPVHQPYLVWLLGLAMNRLT